MSPAEPLANWAAGAPRTIMLATDQSARCDRALDRTVQLARQWGARLIISNVIERVPAGASAAELVSRRKAQLFDDVPKLVPFEVDVRTGPVGETVLAVAAEAGADLIITGVARYNDVGDYVLGTTVDRLARAARAPVLVVKGRARAGYRKLLFATDYSDCAARALQVLPAFPGAEATLVHAYHVPFEGFISREANEAEFRERDGDEAAAFLGRAAPPIRDRLKVANRYGSTCEVLTRAVMDEGFDLSVVATHGKGGLGQGLIGSTGEALLACLPSDVLMVPVPR